MMGNGKQTNQQTNKQTNPFVYRLLRMRRKKEGEGKQWRGGLMEVV